MFNFLTGAFLIASIGLCIWFPSVIYYNSVIANLCFTLVGLMNGLFLYHAFGFDYFDDDDETLIFPDDLKKVKTNIKVDTDFTKSLKGGGYDN
jgi:hypothetical protein